MSEDQRGGYKPRISVIIPCFNIVNYIAECLESVLNQTITDVIIEIICVDDCSEDGTKNVLKEYEMNNPDQIMIIELSENVGQGKARNIGLEYATGEYIAFVDGDDVIAADMLKTLYDIEVNSDSDYSSCEYVKYADGGYPIFTPNLTDNNAAMKVFDFSDPITKKHFIIEKGWDTRVWGRLYKRSFIERASLYFPENTKMEDVFFAETAMMAAYKCAFAERKLYGYRIRESSTMFSDDIQKYYMDTYRVQSYTAKSLLEKNLLTGYRDEFQILYLVKGFVEEMDRMKADIKFFSYDNYKLMKNTLFEIFPDFLNNTYIEQESVKPYICLLTAESEDELRQCLSSGSK
ncbi:MAG: glycosyltransferase [Lachnospiraceae bacterium]|nr:glycosyltransferase [Lachnospiraceae bacterium]